MVTEKPCNMLNVVERRSQKGFKDVILVTTDLTRTHRTYVLLDGVKGELAIGTPYYDDFDTAYSEFNNFRMVPRALSNNSEVNR